MYSQMFIGFVGEQRSGKSRAIRLLGEALGDQAIGHYSFSQPLKKILDIAGLPFTRPNSSSLAELFDKLGGPGTVSRMTTIRARKDASRYVFLDGVRWMTDVEELRKFPLNMLVYITADPEVRHLRATLDPEKPDEASISLDAFVRREQELPTEQLVPRIGSQLADYAVVNNSMDPNFQSLKVKVADLAAFIKSKMA